MESSGRNGKKRGEDIITGEKRKKSTKIPFWGKVGANCRYSDGD